MHQRTKNFTQDLVAKMREEACYAHRVAHAQTQEPFARDWTIAANLIAAAADVIESAINQKEPA